MVDLVLDKASLKLLMFGSFFLLVGVTSVVMVLMGVLGDSFIVEWEFIGGYGVNMGVCVLVDMLSVLFFCLVCIISGCVFIFSVSYMEGDKYPESFCCLTVCFVIAMSVLIFVPHLVFLLVGWDLLGVISFLLVIHYKNKSSVGAGMLTILVNRIGDVFLLISVSFLASFGDLAVLSTSQWGVVGSGVVSILLVMAALTKSAQLPFSAWLPAAMAAPMPISALVHSSTLVTAGVYLLFRYYHLFVVWDGVLVLLSKVGCLTLLMASLGASLELDVKKLIALSTLSHLGFMVYVLGIGYPVFSIFHLFSHALFKSLLFMCVGDFVHRGGVSLQDIRQLCGVGWGSSALLTSCVVVGFSSLCGVPYLGGFYSKHAILESSIVVFGGAFEVLCLLVSAGVSYYYSVRFLLQVVFGVPGEQCYLKSGFFTLWAPMVLLAIGSITFGYVMEHVLVEFCGVFSISFSLKMMLLMVVWLGVVVAVIDKFVGVYESGDALWVGQSRVWRFLSAIKVFLGSMWFFQWSPLVVPKLWFCGGSMVVSALESGWMEVLGGQGVFSWFSMLSMKLFSLECVSVLVVLRFGVMTGMLVLFLLFN
uniref:NADH-ubiquinone oxidoreductase chain 5 n=1 Tax=Quadrula quadrula TaxID=52372 RepID=D2DVZ6_QUAQU|nr:NADH dehydrogenase subunit 5 [Quadrula quadrula]